jgi:hypothetical protein
VFGWQFFQVAEIGSAEDIRRALDSIIAKPDLHRFLRESFRLTHVEAFAIEPLHVHCEIVGAEGDFEDILASAAGDHLGAHSRDLRSANARERQEIAELFARVGHYEAYLLIAGDTPGCPKCGCNSHLFTTWFCGVAWDWCLFAAWPERQLLWMGCLTDTD